MARVRVMYWKEIPVQVQAEDASGRVSRQLDDRFQKAADYIAMHDGSEGTDEYLDAWEFGPYFEVDGDASESIERTAQKLERMPDNFVQRIINMHKDGSRVPTPGAIDHWAES